MADALMQGERPHTLEELAERVHAAHLERLQRQHALREPWPGGRAPELGPSFARCEVVTRQRTLDGLAPHGELPQALRGHVTRLLWERLAQPFAARAAQAWQQPHPRLARTDAPLGNAEQLRRVLLTHSAAAGREGLPLLTQLHGAVHEAESARDEARREIASRLGLGSPLDGALPVREAELHDAAARFLDASEDLVREGLQRARRAQRECDLAQALWTLRGGDVPGLPLRLGPRWLREVLPQFATARLDPQAGQPFARVLLQRLGAPLGVTSFARALSRLGEAQVLCAPLPAAEWVRRVDGAFWAPARTGLLFGSLLSSPAFLARSSDAAPLERERAQRASAWAALFDARSAAATLLAPHARSPRHDEMAHRLFGLPMPRALLGVLPRRDLDRAAPRWLAWLEHPSLQHTALSLFDEDWFRNPRSRSWAMLPPPWSPGDAEARLAHAVRLARHFEVLCG